MILVTGPTGNIGRALVPMLRGVRVLVRDAARAPAGVEHVVGDLDKPETLGAAFDGVEKVFLLTQGIDTRGTVNALAAAKGVRHIVHVSSLHVTYEPLPLMARWHAAREELIRASGVPATFLRPGAFMTNALDWLPTVREGGYVIDPVGPGRFAPIDPEDIAAVAALALTQPGHDGRAYQLTGDEMFTVAQQVAVLSRAIGRPLEARVPADVAQAVRARFPKGAPPVLAESIIEGFQRMRQDTVGLRTDTVEKLLGRKPKTFAQWCERNAALFS
jgi:uncharacterized protein YbjT (DUF2867 family)